MTLISLPRIDASETNEDDNYQTSSQQQIMGEYSFIPHKVIKFSNNKPGTKRLEIVQ